MTAHNEAHRKINLQNVKAALNRQKHHTAGGNFLQKRAPLKRHTYLHAATGQPLFVFAVGACFAVFGFLSCRAAAMSAGDIFLLLGLGLHLAVIAVVCLCLSEHYSATGNYVVDIAHKM